MRFGLTIVRVRSIATMGCGSPLMKMSCVVSITTRIDSRSTTGGVRLPPAAARACARSSASEAAEPSARPAPRRKSRRFTWVYMGPPGNRIGGGSITAAAAVPLLPGVDERLALVDDVHGEKLDGCRAGDLAAMHRLAIDMDGVARLHRLGPLPGDVEIERALHDIGEFIAMMDMRRKRGARRRLDHGHVDFRRRGARQIGVLQHVALDLLLRLEPLRGADAKPDAAQQGERQLQIGPHLALPPLGYALSSPVSRRAGSGPSGKLRRGAGSCISVGAMTAPRLDPRSLAPLFRPASVAVIGASSDPTKLGSIPIGHMKASGFKGPHDPINPKPATIHELPAYATVRAVPGPVDLAVIAVPEPMVLPALRDCAAKGVRAVVLFTSGFAEVSAAGRRAQEEIKALARGPGSRLLGPNCMGLVNFANGLGATFHLAFGPRLAPAGRTGLITHSAAFGRGAYQG